MNLRIQYLCVDTTDPLRLAGFWQEALGWRRTHADDDEVVLEPPAGSEQDGVVPDLLFLHVPEAKRGKDRLHLDLRPLDQDAEVARLEGLGARRVDVGQGEVSWVVLADPDGNELCVLAPLLPQDAAGRGATGRGTARPTLEDMTSPLVVRTPTEVATMREAGRVVAAMLAAVREAVAPGVRLRELDEIARTVLAENGATSPFLDYHPSWAPVPFNGVLCLSTNEVVVHGRPTGARLREGDLLSVDAGATLDGWNGDAAITVSVGTSSEADAALVAATEEALAAGITAAVPGATLMDVAVAVDAVARARGYSHLPDHGGHGIGREMHEAPFVPMYPGHGADQVRLRAGSTLAIEPMLLAGSSRYRTKRDGWSVATVDKARAAHVEHTVAVTDDGPVLLTAP